jgi:hypothetical protein
MADEAPTNAEPQGADERLVARRVLLRRALYTAPAVLGTFIVTRSAAALSCTPGTCNPPQGCGPIQVCNPPQNPCRPDIQAMQAGALMQMARDAQRRDRNR